MQIERVLEDLCGANAPSGFETPVSRVAAELLRPLVDEVTTTRGGSVLGLRRCGRPGAKKLLLDAHLDEVGLITTGIEHGFLRFCSIGGVDPRMLPDREVEVLTDPPLYGVVACLPPHIQKPGESGKAIPLTELAIDVGLTQERASAIIPIGTPIVPRARCFPLGEHRLCGKAMDDRACFAALLRTAELLQDKELGVDIYFLGSTQEEVTGVGAKTAAFEIAPDFCVAVDVTHGDTPDASKDKTFPLGGGAVIGVGPNMTRWMTNRMIEKARERDIPYQLEVMSGHSGTNGWYFQISREGIATAVLSLPLRYMHSPIEVLDKADLEAVAALLAAFAVNLESEAVLP